MRFIKQSNFLKFLHKQCKNFKLVNQQETQSINDLTGSSETVRRITFQFELYNKVRPSHKKAVLNKNSFLSWFIGFVEGDGSFVICNNKVYFDLTQHLKDIDLLYKIKTTLGFGCVLKRTNKHRNVGVFYVTGKDNFVRLAHLFNGNLVSSYKKNQFKNWLHVLNAQYDQQLLFIDSYLIPSFNNAWLSGFIDAEGCFSARLKNCKTCKSGQNLLYGFSLSQKDIQILQCIKNLFDLKKQQFIRFDPSWNGYQFYLSNKKKLNLLSRYLNIYALKTKKKITFLNWAKIHKLGLEKAHLTNCGLNKIKILITKIHVKQSLLPKCVPLPSPSHFKKNKN